jgi:hypothetical protein
MKPHPSDASGPVRATWPHLTVNDSIEDRQRREELLARTLQVWQPYTERELTVEDARQIIENMVGFFDLLIAWNARHQEEEEGKDDQPAQAA